MLLLPLKYKTATKPNIHAITNIFEKIAVCGTKEDGLVYLLAIIAYRIPTIAINECDDASIRPMETDFY